MSGPEGISNRAILAYPGKIGKALGVEVVAEQTIREKGVFGKSSSKEVLIFFPGIMKLQLADIEEVGLPPAGIPDTEYFYSHRNSYPCETGDGHWWILGVGEDSGWAYAAKVGFAEFDKKSLDRTVKQKMEVLEMCGRFEEAALGYED